jgi:hypothetical protein
MKWVIALAIPIAGCIGMVDYLGPLNHAAGTIPIDPETVRVDPRAYPKFRAPRQFQPPRARSPYNADLVSFSPDVILPSDVWEVRYLVGDRYLIVSDAYEARQCDALKETYRHCARNLFGPGYKPSPFHAIWITRDGTSAGGWQMVENPEMVLLAADRRRYLVPPPWGNEGWEGFTFAPIQ